MDLSKTEQWHSNSAKISGNGFEKLIEITDNGSFSDTLKIDKEGYYSLRIGRESTSIYLIKGENIRLTLNAKEFDESLFYSGDIAGENNYLAAKYLLSEKELPFDKVYSLPEDKFIIELNKINSRKYLIDYETKFNLSNRNDLINYSVRGLYNELQRN